MFHVQKLLYRLCQRGLHLPFPGSATVCPMYEQSTDYGRFVPMHFRSRERNDQSEYVRSLERTCGRFVPGTKLPIVTFVH